MLESTSVNTKNFKIKATHPKHYGYDLNIDKKGDFYSLLSKKMVKNLQSVDKTQITSEKLFKKMITNPNEVNIHDVMIASKKAQIMLDLTKTVLQRSASAFQTITSLR